ncbi:hypothetical protein L211DRAFT_870604 [Terfezia boudieri ATCC MYA-4762]|uniref:F-box domain-containing protein n=1 Tax=Terfezia boudieri ATCC MYA-4762 TaxID=1051890 RepID=A0A3N4LRC4_9PEZI|nr:hypothetical protein L211DRAFT_870604 [Terfezia boudieri ATCC MYA-4762]
MPTLLDLPAELLLQILSYLRVGGNIPRQYSRICRHLQQFVDAENLRIFSLRSPDYHHFKAIFSYFPHRRRTLKVLNYIIVLPEYDRHREESELETCANDKAFLNALVPLFKILSTWEEKDGDNHDIDDSYRFTLVLNAVAKPRFSRAVWLSEREMGHSQVGTLESRRRLSYNHRNSGALPDSPLSDNVHTPRSFPRQSPVSLPPGAEANLSTINCVRCLRLNTHTSIDSNDSEFSRDVDLRVLPLLEARMIGLRPEGANTMTPDAPDIESDN